MIKWTKSNRAKLHGFRTTHKTDPEGIALSPTEAAAALRAHASAHPVEWRAEEKYQAALDRILLDLASEAVPTVDPATEIYRAAVILSRAAGEDWMRWEDWAPHRALVGLWASGGTAAALDIMLDIILDENQVLAVEQSLQHRGASERIVRGLLCDKDPSLPARSNAVTLYQSMWEALRCHVGKLSDADFDEANRVAHARRTALPELSHERTAIAFAFDRDGAHAAAEASALLTSVDKYPDTLLLIALRDAELASELHRTRRPLADLGMNAYDLIESHGAAARPMLEWSLTKLGSSYYGGQKYLRAALKLIP